MLTEIKVEGGTTVQINTVVAVIGGAAGRPRRSGRSCPAAAANAEAPKPVARLSRITEPMRRKSQPSELRSSPLVRKIAKENNLDLRQVPGTGSGGRITKEDVLHYLRRGARASPRRLL